MAFSNDDWLILTPKDSRKLDPSQLSIKTPVDNDDHIKKIRLKNIEYDV